MTEGSHSARRFAYADPPYPGCAHLYPEKTEVPLEPLIRRLDSEYPDGWAASTHVRGLLEVADTILDVKAKVASWGRTQGPLHPPLHFVDCWEPVIFKTSHRYVRGDTPALTAIIIATSNRGFMAKRHKQKLIGSKPKEFNDWVLDLLGFREGDTLDDLFPGTGGMGKAARARGRQKRLWARTFVAALTYGDFVCDHCGRPEDNEHENRPEGGPWATWCPYPRDPNTPRFPGQGDGRRLRRDE